MWVFAGKAPRRPRLRFVFTGKAPRRPREGPAYVGFYREGPEKAPTYIGFCREGPEKAPSRTEKAPRPRLTLVFTGKAPLTPFGVYKSK